MRTRRWVVLGLALLLGVGPGAGCGGGGSGDDDEDDDDLCMPAAKFPAGIDHGPVVGRPSPASMTVAWWTTLPRAGSLEVSTDGLAWTRVDEVGVGTDHVVALDGLDADSPYRYRVLSDGALHVGEWAFRTPPATTDATVRFAVIGDSGTGCADAAAVIARIEAEEPDFVLVAGDAAYSSGTAAQVRNGWSIPFARLLARVPVFVVLGNHDVQTLDGAPLLAAAVLPLNGPDALPRTWSADWGPIHLVGFDSTRSVAPGSAQGDWIAADLGARTTPWCVVVGHHPAYSSSSHGGLPSLVTDLVPVLESAAVDLVFAGHDHDYERTFPLSAGVAVAAVDDPDYVDPGAPIYVVTGGGGKDLDVAGTSERTAFSISAFHAVIAEATATTLTWRAVAPDGTVLDQASVTRTK